MKHRFAAFHERHPGRWKMNVETPFQQNLILGLGVSVSIIQYDLWTTALKQNASRISPSRSGDTASSLAD